jgi:ketosteroid isomerase-like protein
MNTIKKISLLVLFLVLSCQNTHIPKASKVSLTATLKKFNRAFASGHIPKLVTMITDDYTHTNGSAKAIHAKDWLSYLQKRNQELQSGDLVVHHYQMDQTEIVLHGTTAIVTGRVQTSFTHKGKKQERAYRVTQLWVFKNERWQRAGFHDSKIPLS